MIRDTLKGRGGNKPQEDSGQLVTCQGQGCVCRSVTREAMKGRQWFEGTRKPGEGVTDQKLRLEFSQGKSLGPGWSEAVTGQAAEVLSLLGALRLGHPHSDLWCKLST